MVTSVVFRGGNCEKDVKRLNHLIREAGVCGTEPGVGGVGAGAEDEEHPGELQPP